MSICKVHVPGDCAGNCEQRRSSVKAVTPAPKMGSRGPCCAHHIPLSRNCDACNVWAGGRAGSGQCTHGNTGFCSQCYERDDKSGWRARAEAAEQRFASLELDRDEWKQACVDGNTRFQRSEAERRAMSDCEHGFPDGFGCALRCGEIRAEETDPDAVREPATGAGRSLVETLRMHRTNWRASDLLEPPIAIDLADRIDVLAELMLKGGEEREERALSICKVHIPGDCAGDCEQRAKAIRKRKAGRK